MLHLFILTYIHPLQLYANELYFFKYFVSKILQFLHLHNFFFNFQYISFLDIYRYFYFRIDTFNT